MSGTAEGIWAPYEGFYIEVMLSNTHSAIDSLERLHDVMEAIEADSAGEVHHHIDPAVC